MLIPWQQLDQQTLDNLITSFVLREGSDYGEQEISLADKVAQVKQQIQQGLVVISYSPLHDSVSLHPASHFTDNGKSIDLPIAD